MSTSIVSEVSNRVIIDPLHPGGALACLPPEIREQIFDYVDDVSILSLNLTCDYWKQQNHKNIRPELFKGTKVCVSCVGVGHFHLLRFWLLVQRIKVDNAKRTKFITEMLCEAAKVTGGERSAAKAKAYSKEVMASVWFERWFMVKEVLDYDQVAIVYAAASADNASHFESFTRDMKNIVRINQDGLIVYCLGSGYINTVKHIHNAYNIHPRLSARDWENYFNAAVEGGEKSIRWLDAYYKGARVLYAKISWGILLRHPRPRSDVIKIMIDMFGCPIGYCRDKIVSEEWNTPERISFLGDLVSYITDLTCVEAIVVLLPHLDILTSAGKTAAIEYALKYIDSKDIHMEMFGLGDVFTPGHYWGAMKYFPIPYDAEITSRFLIALHNSKSPSGDILSVLGSLQCNLPFNDALARIVKILPLSSEFSELHHHSISNYQDYETTITWLCSALLKVKRLTLEDAAKHLAKMAEMKAEYTFGK